MKEKLLMLGLLCAFAIGSVMADIEYPDYYCETEAYSVSLPFGWEDVHTYGQHKVGNFYYYILDEDKCEVALVSKHRVRETCQRCMVACAVPTVEDWDKENYEGDIDVPSSVEIEGKTYSVVMVGYGVFYGSEKLRSVTFPESVRFVSTHTFADCPNLESVKFRKGTFISTDLFPVNKTMKELDLSECKAALLMLSCEGLEVLKFPESFIEPDYINTIYFSGYTQPREIWFYSKEINFRITAWDKYTEREDLIIYVPKGCKEMYMESLVFKQFKTKNYIEFDTDNPSEVEQLENIDDTKAEYFDIRGRAVVEPESGIYIRRQGDKAEKIYIR